MKKIINTKLLIIFSVLSLSSCSEYTDLENANAVTQSDFYRDENELNMALAGSYSSLRAPIADEWYLTEIRSDNTYMGTLGSTTNRNFQVISNDIFETPTFNVNVQDYWKNTYKSIRVINGLMNTGLKTSYDATTGTINYDNGFGVTLGAGKREAIAGQASFLRAYHYFNLVRLFGEVYLLDNVISPDDALYVSKSSVASIYKFIIADLENAVANCSSTPYSTSSTYSASLGFVNKYTAEALLAKVYLTLGRQADALPLLTDVISFSGYSLVTGSTTSYSDVFSITNEMNKEMMFAVRFKAGALGYGSSLANLFAPTLNNISTEILLSIPTGTLYGLNNPTAELAESYASTDVRKAASFSVYKPLGSDVGDADYDPLVWTYWVKKHNSASLIANDSEKDWPILRYSDVLLMYCEAVGVYNTTTLGYINQIRGRAYAPLLVAADVDTQAKYEKAVANERRWEFALENQRWFDLLRFKTTLPSVDPQAVMKAHFTNMYLYYAEYNPSRALSDILDNVDDQKFWLLPIPLQEITTNTVNEVTQNPGY